MFTQPLSSQQRPLELHLTHNSGSTNLLIPLNTKVVCTFTFLTKATWTYRVTIMSPLQSALVAYLACKSFTAYRHCGGRCSLKDRAT